MSLLSFISWKSGILIMLRESKVEEDTDAEGGAVEWQRIGLYTFIFQNDMNNVCTS